MNLGNLNLVELNAQEVQEVEGGFIWAVFAAGILTDWAGFKKGLVDGFSSSID